MNPLLLRDDGGIYWLNGFEIARNGVAPDPVDFATYTPRAVADDGAVFQEMAITPAELVGIRLRQP